MSNLVDVKVPDLGGHNGVPVIEVLVRDGDSIQQEQVLLVLESDKATMEVPSPAAGIVRGMKVQVGAHLSVGDVICQLEVGEARGTGDGGRETQVAQPAPVQMPQPVPPPAPAADVAATVSRPPSPVSQLQVTIPDLGNNSNVPIIELLVAEGSTVAKDATLLVLESDKSTMEVPAPADGIVRGLLLKVGDKVSAGTAVCTLETAGGASAPAPTPAAAPTAPVPVEARGHGPLLQSPAPAPAPVGAAHGRDTPAAQPVTTSSEAHAGPATRKFARELGVDLAQVKGSGLKARVTIEDVQAHVKALMSAGAVPSPVSHPTSPGGSGIPPIPAQDFSAYGPTETKPLARIRKISAAHLSRAWLNVPHVTQFEEADISELEAFRKAMNEENPTAKLTLLPFLMKAVATAFKAFPEFNSSLAPAGDALILKNYCHIGFAADTENGLVVPVVKNVWDKGIAELARECGELAKKARDGKLKPDDMRGGCFSISSLGGLGVSGHFTPIVNAPEVAILGVSKAVQKPVWDGKAFAPRLMLPLSLSYDHRVIDGAYAARFTVALVKLVGDLRRLVL